MRRLLTALSAYTPSEWAGAACGVFGLVLWVLYLFGPAGGRLMP